MGKHRMKGIRREFYDVFISFVIAAALIAFVVTVVLAVLFFVGKLNSGAHPADRKHATASYYQAGVGVGTVGSCGDKLRGRYIATRLHYGCGSKLRIFRHHRSITVHVADTCGCPADLAKRAFAKLCRCDPQSVGVMRVAIAKIHEGYWQEHPWLDRYK